MLAAPGVILRGSSSWIDAALDPQTRTLAVRAEVDNPGGRLRPGLSGRARLRVPIGSQENPPLVVPATAVVDTGLRQIVWREDEEGVLEPVEVTVAARAGPACAISSGLEEGERVVVQGAFLLSADQRLRPVVVPDKEDVEQEEREDHGEHAETGGGH
jgi:Cu(I)/Ag(I) efflux system membrane fusion protein